jgi:tRNA A-37 threonylcarbamoyl transferase component Bud32
MDSMLYLAIRARDLQRSWRRLTASHALAQWRARQGVVHEQCKGGVNPSDLGLNEHALAAVREESMRSKKVVIAEIDHDGFFLSHFGRMEGLPCVEPAQFQARSGFPLRLVAVNGMVGVHKDFGLEVIRFLNELDALHSLNLAECNVPAILDVDFEAHTLTTTFIAGKVLREALAARGALVRDRDIALNSAFAGLSEEELRLKRVEQGRKYLLDVVDQHFIERTFQQLMRIHSAGFIINDIKYGNIIIAKDTGAPYFIDFERSDRVSGLGQAITKPLFERDIGKFNVHFGTSKFGHTQ